MTAAATSSGARAANRLRPQRARWLGAAGLVLAIACESSSPDTSRVHPTPAVTAAVPVTTALPGASAARAGPSSPRFIPAPSELGAVEPFIQEQVELGVAAGERTLVYVGATWCEPCQRFHAAVQRGELGDVLARTRLVEFDADHHNAALHRAGYAYELIPVIALPNPDGRSSGRLLSGSIKGPTAVTDNLLPRLRALLDGRQVD
jgi:hypothetical protein